MSDQFAVGSFIEPAEAEIRIYLLGPPRVEWASDAARPRYPLAIPRRQARALCYRLGAYPQPVSREHLHFLFWPDTPESTCRRKFSRLLTHLRRALPVPEVLAALHDHVGLMAPRCWSDTAAFEQLCSRTGVASAAQGADHRIPPARPGARRDLERAVVLYHGPFLAGFSLPDCPEFEAWAALERARWERMYLEALAALIEEYTTSGEYAAAIACARRYLATDELAEDIHRRLIELCAATGERSAALRQFERCVTVLERELGVSPLPETQAAYRAALAGETRPGPRDLVPGMVGTRPAWATLPGPDVPLVGREEAFQQLERAYTRARAGHGEVVLIVGEPGIGKSRLMQDFATRRQAQALVLAGAGYPGAQVVPYQPLLQALRTVLGTGERGSRGTGGKGDRETRRQGDKEIGRQGGGWAGEHGTGGLSHVWLAEVSRLMPELRGMVPDLPAPVPAEPAHARVRLFEALSGIVLGLAAGPRVVLLCLDDLHWVDDTTLDWLAYLGQRLPGNRVLVIGTCRSADAGALAGLRHSLTRQRVLCELRLVGLDEAAVLQLLRYLAPVSDDSILAGRLHRATGGNPLFLLETLRALVESGGRLEALASLEGLSLPDSVRDAVVARVEHLSARARQVLEAGAVLGQVFDFQAVHRVAGRRDLETMDGLDELVAHQLLVEQAAGYRFQHEIVQEVVYRELSPGRRRLLHRRVGEALERLRPDEVAALGWHLERAEEPGRAARYVLQAGQAAKATFARAEARACFERALALLEQEAARLRDAEPLAANRRLRIEVLYERGWALRLVGDMEAYARDLQEVGRLAGLLGDARSLAHLRWREAYNHRWFCRYAEARQAAEEGLGLAQAAADPLLEAMCWREVGVVARAMGDYEWAREALERALHLFTELGDAVYEIHTLGNLSTLYWYLGDAAQAMEWAHLELARCDEAGLPLQRRLPLGDLGAAAAAAGDGALARRCLRESLSIARQVADRTQEILCLGHLGWLCVKEGQAADGSEHLRAALALAEGIDSRTEQAWLHAGLAEAYGSLGSAEQAKEHARRALELAQACGQTYDLHLARGVLDRLEAY